jgi:hypothetical protein
MESILKNNWLDIAVTVAIAVAVFSGNEVLRWVVLIYTPLMLLLKIVAFSNRHSTSRIKPKDSGTPPLFYHILYGVNVAILLYGSLVVSRSWWWVTACWALIWILSAAAGTGSKTKPKSAA